MYSIGRQRPEHFSSYLNSWCASTAGLQGASQIPADGAQGRSQREALLLTKHLLSSFYLPPICLSHRSSPLPVTCLFSLSLCIAFCSLSYPLSLDFALSPAEDGKRKRSKNEEDGRGAGDSQSVRSTQQVMIRGIFHHDKGCRGVDSGRVCRNVWKDEC